MLFPKPSSSTSSTSFCVFSVGPSVVLLEFFSHASLLLLKIAFFLSHSHPFRLHTLVIQLLRMRDEGGMELVSCDAQVLNVIYKMKKSREREELGHASILYAVSVVL